MLLSKSNLTAALVAATLALGPAAPAQALGKNERNFLKGLAAAAIIGAIANDVRQKNRRAAPPVYQDVPQAYYPPQGGHRPVTRHDNRHDPRYDQAPPRAKTGRVIGADGGHGSGVNQTASARVFNSYAPSERREIQRRLAQYGYYAGAIDGSFGPRTHQAIYAFARAAGRTEALNSTSGAYAVMDALLA